MERRRWNTDLKHPKEGRVAAGKYSRLVGSTIDPLWPSSARTTQHNEGYGWVKYSFEATFSKYTMGALAPILTDTQEVWVLNSALLPDTQLRIERPFVNQNTWDGMKSKSSPLKLTLPSSTLMMGQVVPVTVRMSELKFKSKYVGQLPVVLAAYFALKQNVVGRATAHSIIWKYSEDVMTLPMKDGWPRSTDGWERTVHLTMPTSPDVAADTKSKFMDISHSLKLVMKIKAERQNDLQAKEYLTKGTSDPEISLGLKYEERNIDTLYLLLFQNSGRPDFSTTIYSRRKRGCPTSLFIVQRRHIWLPSV
ncbi:hypothetical protein BC939DRAFT_201309 [Gamsiella multidivaricata]|uniref:uncharacterized protein n=1 Tax=Gamsiella multidivaricata TaxID=101098 RepID=UPI00221EDEE2|nr:uncharacterized protein BC939DRAFT_201309 [Gamsiella multidivaricata]KAI7821679.1 hypothetical protein BC939DRAFT_201309 [Gamsiella multidivaricata]